MNMPTALAVVWALVKSNYPPSAKLKSLYKFDQVLGLGFEKVAREASNIPQEVRGLVNERENARSRGDFKNADKIRGKIREKGYEVIDSKTGQKLKKIVKKTKRKS